MSAFDDYIESRKKGKKGKQATVPITQTINNKKQDKKITSFDEYVASVNGKTLPKYYESMSPIIKRDVFNDKALFDSDYTYEQKRNMLIKEKEDVSKKLANFNSKNNFTFGSNPFGVSGNSQYNENYSITPYQARMYAQSQINTGLLNPKNKKNQKATNFFEEMQKINKMSDKEIVKKYNDLYHDPERVENVKKLEKINKKQPLYDYLSNYEKVQNEDYTFGTHSIAGLESAFGLVTKPQYKTKDINGKDVTVELPGYWEMKSDKAISESDSTAERIFAQGIRSTTQMIPTLVIHSMANVLAPGSTVAPTVVSMSKIGADSYRGSRSEKILEGHSKEQASLYATGDALIEVGTEMMFDSFKLLSNKPIFNTSKLTNKIHNRVAQNLVKLGLSGIEEGTEEAVGALLRPALKKITLNEDNGKPYFQKVLEDENLVESFFSAMVSSAILGGQTSVRETRNLSAIDNATFDNIEAEIGRKLTEPELKRVIEDVSKINERMLENNSRNIGEIIEEATNNFIQNNNNDNNNSYLQTELQQLTEQRKTAVTPQQISQIDARISEIQQQLSEVQDKVNLPGINQLQSNNTNGFKYELTNNEKVNTLYKSANQYLDDSQQTHDLVNTIEKVVSDKGYNILFDDTIGDNVNAQIRSLNGEIEIKLNPNTDRAGEFLLAHEITHAIGTEEMKSMVMEYATKNSEFNNALETLKQNYKTSEITDEVLADISGQLFGNQEFINSLVMQNTTESKKIIRIAYEKIKRLLNQLTEKGRYRNFVQDLENKWREAYRISTTEQAISNLKGDTYYHRNVENNANLGYNNNGIERTFNTIEEAVEDDPRKLTFTKYNTSVDFFNLSYEDMKKAIKIGSKYALEAQQLGLDNYSFNDNKYNYYIDILDKNNNAFGVTHIETINSISKEVANETNPNKNSRNTLESSEYEGRDSSINIESTENRGTSKGNVTLPGIKQRQQRSNENRQNIENDFTNSREELDNSSFLMDNKGRQLSKDQQEFFKNSKVKDENGNLMVMYHGTPNGDFTVFNPGSYFSERQEYASGYENESASSISSGKKTTTPKTYEVYLNITNPFTLQDETAKNIYLNEYIKGGNSLYYDPYTDYTDTINNMEEIDWTEGEDLREWLKENHPEYDGLILDEGGDGGYGMAEYIWRGKSYVPFNSNQIKNVSNQNPTSDSDIRYSKNTNITDSNGRKISKEQQEYFKDSKARDESGKLEVVYHTTTEDGYQFNEFNPVGTPGYRFGDQVVNYYTDSADMSGSYADQDYIMADTKRITSMEEVQEYIKDKNELGWGSDKTYELIQDNGKYKLIDNSKVPNTNKTWKQVYDEANEYKNTLTEKELSQFNDMFDKISDYNSDGKYNIDSYLMNNNYKFGSEEDAIAQKFLNIDNKNVYERGIYFDALFRNAKYHTIGEFNDKQDLFRNIKSKGSTLAKRQYEGYVNITNPYVVDAEKRNWNQVISQSNDFIDELEERVPQTKKDELTRLYQESANKSSDLRLEHDKTKMFLDQIDRFLEVDKNTDKIKKVADRIGYDVIDKITSGITENLGVNTYYALAEQLELENVIGKETSKMIIDDFVIPEQVQKWLTKNYNKQLKIKDLGVETNLIRREYGVDKISIGELFDKYQKAYNEFDKYRMPYNYFIEKISNDSSDEGHVDLGYELNDIFETRAEIKGADAVGEELAQASSVGWSKPELIRLWGTSKTTNDVVKEIIASNKDGITNYDGVIIKNVYDYGGKSGDTKSANNLYITFNSNQFKALDNNQPTSDQDIRYSNENDEWNNWLDRNFKSTGTTTKLNEIRLPKKDIKLPGVNKQDKVSDIELPFETDDLPFDMEDSSDSITNNIDQTTVNRITKNLKSELGLNGNEISEFKRVLFEISNKDNISKNEIKNIIEERFAEKTLKHRMDDIIDIQRYLKKQKINVSDRIKADITDYSDFRQRNYGKINFSKEGQSVDVIYQELSDMFPSYFSKDILSDSDQLQEIAYVANLDRYVTETAFLSEDAINRATEWIYDSIEDYNLQQDVKNQKMSYDEYLEKSKLQNMKKTRKMVQDELLEEMGIDIDELEVGKDISSIAYQRTDPIRVNEKVFGWDVGQKINAVTINKTKHNEAERTRFLNKERNEIKNLGIKARTKESSAVQKYAEKQYVNDKGEVVPYGDHQLASEFPDVATQNRIKNASKVLRNKYDQYINAINNIITDMGYDPIPKRQDYMKHFTELSDKLSQWGIPLNRNSLSEDALPTDINGITDQFNPGKNWFASAMKRKGVKTTYDAITGIDSYLEGASNLIFHTEDIQRYRALSKLIRDTYGQTHGMDNIDLSTEEGQQRLNNIFDNKLSKYVAWLDEQANALAGKKGAIDRGAERALGRKIYGVLETAKKQVGSNMTGYNVRSALTNFASAVQGVSKTNKMAWLKGTASTIKNMIHDDGLINKSDFLTSRFGSDQLSSKLWQKASKAGQVFMEGTDYFTANQIWRGKYYENLQKGMTEQQAIKKADDFASRIMGDRSKGATAEIFNSKTLGLLTQFQLEVNNQWSSLIHDNKMDVQSKNKSGATVVFQLGQLFAFSYMFNGLMKSLTGSDVMVDPIDMLMKMLGSGDDEEEKTLEERATEVIGDLWNDIPFVSFASGGRVPVGEALKGGETLIKYATGQTNSYGQKYKLEDVKKDLMESTFYWLLPTGYGQLRKAKKGLEMYDKDLILPGSYTPSGNLRFTADDSTSGKVKAVLFGQYSSDESQKYISSGFKAISKSRVQELKDLGMTASEYRKYNEGLKKAGNSNEAKMEYITNSKYTNKQKTIMAQNVLKKDIDIKEYNKYKSYDEYKYATQYPEKYSVVSQIGSFDKYTKWKNEIKDIRDNTKNDKVETIKYINGLNLSIPQKAMFIKLYYPSFNSYNKEIVNYINEQYLTMEEKITTLEKMKFKIRNGRVYW